MNHIDAQLQKHSCQHTRTYDDGICADCGYNPEFPDERHSPNTPLYGPIGMPTAANKRLERNKIAREWDDFLAASNANTTHIPTELYNQLNYLGLIPTTERAHNVGASDYSKQLIQPWSIWLSYPDLSAFELDIIKRILRTKSTDSRRLDYEKCQHILTELLRQLDAKEPT